MTQIPQNEFITPLAVKYHQFFVKIVTTIVSMDGWATPEKACTLAALVLTHKPALVVEIGVWGGRSLLPMALACKEAGSGKVIGIDPYDAQLSAKDEFPDSAEWWAAQDHQAVLRKFLNFEKLLRVENQIELLRKRSDDVDPPQGIGLLHIDGSHMEQAVKDAERFCPNVTQPGPGTPGGFVVFDDLTWIGGAVLRAMDVAEGMGYKEIFRCVNNTGDNWALFQRA